jgi:predicted nucleic acid-binding protein
MICADSSLVAKWLFPDEEDAAIARRFLTEQVARREPIIAPFLLQDEFTNVVRKKIRIDRFPSAQADEVLDRFFDLPIAFRTPERLYHTALRIANEYNLHATYDAEYLALAQITGCEFWTADLELVHAVKRHMPFVRTLSEYEPAS